MRSSRITLFVFAAVVTKIVYWTWFRPWSNQWGVSTEIASRMLPGDDIVPEPEVQTTQGIVIDAPTAAIWPWLIQMGPGRAGAYTYDWIENLAGLNMHSPNRIVTVTVLTCGMPSFDDGVTRAGVRSP